MTDLVETILAVWFIITVATISFLISDKKDFPELTIGDLLITVIFWPLLLIIALMMFVENVMSINIRKED